MSVCTLVYVCVWDVCACVYVWCVGCARALVSVWDVCVLVSVCFYKDTSLLSHYCLIQPQFGLKGNSGPGRPLLKQLHTQKVQQSQLN